MLSRLATSSLRVSGLASTSGLRLLSQTTSKAARYGFTGRSTQQTAFNLRQQAGPTLKERLLGPTTGAPYIYGTYAIAGASALGIGALMYYGLGLSKETSILDKSSVWPQYVRDRLAATYSYVAGGLAVTAASGIAASRSPAIMRLTAGGGLLAFMGTLAAIMGTGMLVRSIDYENTTAKHLAWMLHAGTMGAVLAPLVFLGGPVLVRAAWYTAGIVAGLSATAITAPSEKFLNMGGPLAMGLGVVFVSNIGAFFFPPGSAVGAGLMSIVMYGGLILFSMYLLHDTQRVVRVAEAHPTRDNFYGLPPGTIREFDPINASVFYHCLTGLLSIAIYLDILNIFIRLAYIMGMGGNRRK